MQLPVPVRDAIAASYHISPDLGAAVDDLVTRMWGDAERVQEVAARWRAAADEAGESMTALRREVRAAAEAGYWEGPARDAYQRWSERLVGETMGPLHDGLRETAHTLDAAADTVDAVRVALVGRCCSFTGAIAGLAGAGTGHGTVLVSCGAWLVSELLAVRDAYAGTLDEYAARLRRVRDAPVRPRPNGEGSR